jgi:hypothetical protein
LLRLALIKITPSSYVFAGKQPRFPLARSLWVSTAQLSLFWHTAFFLLIQPAFYEAKHLPKFS